ncbi:hypothetical protein OIU84_022507 [Salix udensis]|uniref:Secreted protein n=1 Tax=Salix udensis TaxID=889485 RepID=A0AAD6PFB1_9ROSI|nr:hypothetical protein OIU84_022507 [Salix udensis]
MGGNLVAAPTMKMPLLLLGLMKVWMGTVKVADESSNVTSNTVTELGETKKPCTGQIKKLCRFTRTWPIHRSIKWWCSCSKLSMVVCIHDDSGSGGYWGTSSASQDQLVAATQASLSPLICSCCPYSCHCSVAPCSSFSSCTFGRDISW